MKKRGFRKVLSLLMAVALFMTSIPMSAFTSFAGTAEDWEIDEGNIAVGEEKTVTLSNGDYHVFWLTPSETGFYRIDGKSSNSRYVYLSVSKDGNTSIDMSIYKEASDYAKLIGGQEYKVTLYGYDCDGTFTINKVEGKEYGAISTDQNLHVDFSEGEVVTYTFSPDEVIDHYFLFTLYGKTKVVVSKDGYNYFDQTNYSNQTEEDDGNDFIYSVSSWSNMTDDEYSVSFYGGEADSANFRILKKKTVTDVISVGDIKPLHNKSQEDLYTFVVPEDNFYTFTTVDADGTDDGKAGQIYVSISCRIDDNSYGQFNNYFLKKGTECKISVIADAARDRQDVGFTIKKDAVNEGTVKAGESVSFQAEDSTQHFILFTPSESGKYEFASSSDINYYDHYENLTGYVYNTQTGYAVGSTAYHGSNYHTGNEADFLSVYSLEAGKTYALKVYPELNTEENGQKHNIALSVNKLNIVDGGEIGIDETKTLEFTQDNQRIELKVNAGTGKSHYAFYECDTAALFGYRSTYGSDNTNSFSKPYYSSYIYDNYTIFFSAPKGSKVKVILKDSSEADKGEVTQGQKMYAPDASEKYTYTLNITETNLYKVTKNLPQIISEDGYTSSDYDYNFNYNIKDSEENYVSFYSNKLLKAGETYTVTLTSSAVGHNEDSYLVIEPVADCKGEINVGETKTINITEDGTKEGYMFKPDEAGKYVVYSKGDANAKLTYYDCGADYSSTASYSGRFNSNDCGFYRVLDYTEGDGFLLCFGQYYDNETGSFEIGVEKLETVDEGALTEGETKKITLMNDPVGKMHTVRYTVPKDGDYTMYVDCVDEEGNVFSGYSDDPYYYYTGSTSTDYMSKAWSAERTVEFWGAKAGDELVLTVQGPALGDLNVTLALLETVDMGEAALDTELKTGNKAKTLKYTFTAPESNIYSIDQYFYDAEQTGRFDSSISISYELNGDSMSSYAGREIYLTKDTVCTITVTASKRDTDSKEYFKIRKTAEISGELSSDKPLNISIAESGEYKLALVTPKQDGEYVFYTDGIYATTIVVKDIYGNNRAGSTRRELENEEKNARVSTYLEGGQTYLVSTGLYYARYYADGGSYTLNMAVMNRKELTPLTVGESRTITFNDTNTLYSLGLTDSFEADEMVYIVTVDTDGPVNMNTGSSSESGIVGGHEVFAISVDKESIEFYEFALQAKKGTKATIKVERVVKKNKGTISVGDDVEIGQATVNNIYKFVPAATGIYMFNSEFAVGEETETINFTVSRDGAFVGNSTSMFLTGGAEYEIEICGSMLNSGRTTGGFITAGETPAALTINTAESVTIDQYGVIKYFSFTPETSGSYSFTSLGSCDTYGYFYSEEGTVTDDDSGSGTNFLINAYLEAGVTYCFGARLYSDIGSFEVAVTDGGEIIHPGVGPSSKIEKTVAAGEEIELDFTTGAEIYEVTCTTAEAGQYFINMEATERCAASFKVGSWTHNYSSTTGISRKESLDKDFAFVITLSSAAGCKAKFSLVKVTENDLGSINADEEITLSGMAVDDIVTFKAPKAGYYRVASSSYTTKTSGQSEYKVYSSLNVYKIESVTGEDGTTQVRSTTDLSDSVVYLKKNAEIKLAVLTTMAEASKADLISYIGTGTSLTLDSPLKAQIAKGGLKVFTFKPSEDGTYRFYSVNPDKEIYVVTEFVNITDSNGIYGDWVQYNYRSENPNDFNWSAKLEAGKIYAIVASAMKSSSSSYYEDDEETEDDGVPAAITLTVEKDRAADIDDGVLSPGQAKTITFNDYEEHHTLRFNTSSEGKHYVLLTADGRWDGVVDFDKKDRASVGNSEVNYLEREIDSGRTFYFDLYGKKGTKITITVANNDFHTCDYSETETVEATCYREGCTMHICPVCHRFTKDNIVPMKEHAFERLIKTIEEPGCEKEGLGFYACLYCSEYDEKAIPALGHDYGEFVVTSKASPSKNGTAQKKCSRCDDTQTITIAKPAKITLSQTSYTADGTAKKPAVTVTDSDGKTIGTANYTVTYTNNTNAGTATAKVTFKGDTYEGTLSANFTIKDNTVLSGTCGTNAKWTLNTVTGLMSITGTGAMTDYQYSSRTPWFKYRDKIKKVSIATGITRIGTNTFYGCTNLTEVTGCANVESIGINTFRNCPILTKVAGCTKATLIEQYAFCGSNKFATIGSTAGTVNLPNCTKIGGYTFYECKGIKKLVTSSAMTYIGTRSFSNCTGMTTVTVGSACKTIGSYAFCGNTALTTVSGCAGLTGIGDFAFFGNTKLTSVAGCTKVANIGKSIFRNCSALVKVGATANQINFAAAKAVGEYAFSGCKAAKYISLGTGVKTIGQYAFQNDAALEKLYIGSTALTTVGANAFKGFKWNGSIYVPKAKLTAYKNGVLKGKGQGIKVTIKSITA